MAPPAHHRRPQPGLTDFLTFERVLSGPLVHLIYWAGLALIAIAGFGALGATVGVALREGELAGILMAVVSFVAGLLVLGAVALIWRAVCEFYVAVFQISEDLRAMRVAYERESAEPVSIAKG